MTTSVTAAVQQVIDRFGRIDVLVNNAGIGSMGAAEENSVAQAQGVFDVNVFGVMRMAKAVLPHMRAQGRGRIINLSSVLGFLPSPYMAVYAASKHAIEGYSESLDHEIREHGVRALLVEPAYTNTGFEAKQSAARHAPAGLRGAAARLRRRMMAAAIKDGDDPAIVAKVIVTAATDPKPKLRYTAGPRPDAPAHCAASLLPGSSTSRSASSTGWPADACPRQSPRKKETHRERRMAEIRPLVFPAGGKRPAPTDQHPDHTTRLAAVRSARRNAPGGFAARGRQRRPVRLGAAALFRGFMHDQTMYDR